MSFSMNEIEATAKRAARGAGRDWGIAEEAGKAARWLAERGLPGPELLAEALTRTDGKDYAALAPASTAGVWRAPSGALCPLIAGAALSDRAEAIAAGGGIELGPVALPLLLAPYAAMAARASGAAIRLSWPGAAVTVFPDGGLAVDGSAEAVAARVADGVQCRRAMAAVPPPRAEAPSGAVDAETWSRLAAFAQRTFAPASEASRLLGAGAGLSDND